MDETTGDMTEAEVAEWLQDWIKVPGLVRAMQEMKNRRDLVTTTYRLASGKDWM